jgi:outer membrane receptor for ferrienterochelin and colicins
VSRLVTTVLVLLLGGAAAAESQQGLDPTAMSLEDLMATPVDQVYGASKFLQKVSDAPASVTIITAEDIALYGYRTLADVLRSVEGLSVSYDRNYSYLGMRGLSRPGDYNSRVLIMIDGHRTNENVAEQATLGTPFQVDVSLIDRIEVIRGPSAALYGSSAFSAVIAVTTKRGHDVDGLQASASAASYDTRHGAVTWGKRYGTGLELLVSGAAHRADGPARLFFPEFDAPDTNGGYADRSDADRADNVGVTASAGDFTLHGIYSSRTKQVPTASFDTVFNSASEKTVDDRAWLDLQFTKEMRRSVKVLARAYWDRYVYDGHYPYSSETADEGDAAGLVMNRDRLKGVWWGGEVAVSSRVGLAHRLTAGTEFRHNVRQSQVNYDEAPRTLYLDSRPQSYTLALNLQDEYTISRRVLLNVAGRAERLATGATGFTPKVGVILTPHTRSTVKLLFSRALRAPSAYELYYDSPSNAGNIGLRAERTQSVELNVGHFLTPSMRIHGALFHNTYRDLIVGGSDASGVVVLRNGLDVHADGLELAWTMKRRSGMQARVSFSKVFESDAASNAWSSAAPRHLAKVNVGRSVAPLGLTVGVELQYESERHTHVGETLSPATVMNLNLVRSNLVKGLDLHASLFNLLDGHYSEPVSENHRQGSITQDGRQLRVGLTWRLK